MPIGKYSGMLLKDVPKDYLKWFHGHLHQKGKLSSLERSLWNYLIEYL